MTSAVEVPMWEARPGVNKYSEYGQLLVKKSDPSVKPTISGEIYVCCGRGFLTKESLHNHRKGNCLQLEENSEKRPKRFDELSQSYFSNLLMLKPACEDDDPSESLPEAFVVLERLDPALIVSACRRKKDIPRLSTVKNRYLDDNDRLSKTLSDNGDLQESRIPKPVSSLFPLPHVLSTSCNGVAENVTRKRSDNGDFQESRIPKPVSSLYTLPHVLSTSCDGVAENVTRKPFECVYCVFSSKFFSNLSNHYKRQHPETKEAGVDFTKHYFAAKSIAKKRIQSKVGSKTTRSHYSTCKLCSRRTSSLSAHMKNSHVKNGQKCKLCNSSFASSKGLKLHITFFHNAVLKQNTALNATFPNPKSKSSIEEKIQPRTVISNTNTNSSESSFKCNLCHINLGSDQKLQEHKNNSHVPNSQYRCIFCSCGFTNDSLLDVHLAAYHNAKQIAPVSSTPTPDSDPEKTFKCTDCTWKFKRHNDLQTHRVTAHVVGGFQCTDCSCSFSTDGGLKRHFEYRHVPTHGKLSPTKSMTKSPIKHLSEKRTRISLGNRTNETGLNEDQSMLTCPEGCNCPILDKETLENHLKLVHPHREDAHSFSCKFCNEKFPVQQDRNIHLDEKHATLVEVRKNILRDLKASSDSKEGKKGVLCQLCPVRITTLTCLDYHLKNSHNPDFQYQCPSCSCRFETERGLDIHTLKTHASKTKVSPKKKSEGSPTSNQSPKKTVQTCPLCWKRQKDKNDLILHLQTAHVPNGKFQCQSCCCCYNTEVELTDHNYNAHGNIFDEERQKFVCDLCGSAKYTLSHLEEHKKKEHAKGGKFFCTKCSCRFAKHKFLKRHLDRVHNIPNYQIMNCTVCSAEIYSTAELNFHMKAAHVENGLACSYCPCQFSSQLFLNSHLKQDHPENETEERSPSRLRACRLKPVSYNEDYIFGVAKRFRSKSETKEVIKKPDKFSCSECAWTFSTSTVLARHKITCHDERNTFSCKECPCVFAHQKGADIHYKLRHQKPDEGKPTKRKRTLSETETENSSVEVNNSFQNKTCSEIFVTDNELNEPTESDTIVNSSTQATEIVDLLAEEDCQINDIFEDASDSTDMDVGNVSSNFSEVNSFATQSTIVMSSPQKEPTKQLSESPPSDNFLTCRCKKCSIIFISIDLLLEHLKMAHKVNTLFKCSLCRATFVSPLLLTKHLKIHAPLYATEAGNNVSEATNRESPPNKKLRNSYDSYASKIGVDKPYRCRKCAHYYFDTVLSLAQHIRSQHDVSEYTACTKCGLSFMTGDLIGMLEHEKDCLSSKTRDSLNRNDKELASAYNRNSFSAVSDVPNVQIVSKSGNPRKSTSATANINGIEVIELEYSDDDADEVNIVEEIGKITTGTTNTNTVIPLSGNPSNNLMKQNLSNDIGVMSFTENRIGDVPTANKDHIRFECIGNNTEQVEFVKSTTPITIISLSDDSNDAFDVANNGKSKTPAYTNEKTRELPKSIFETSDILDRYRTVFNVSISQKNNKDIDSATTIEDPSKPYRKSPVARKSTSGIPKHRSKIFLDRFFGRAPDASESENAKSSTCNEGETSNPKDKAVNEEVLVNNDMSKSTSKDPPEQQDIPELQNNLSKEASANLLEDESCLSDDDASNISVQRNMGSDTTITDYDSSEVDYSDICFKCGNSFLNLESHEVQCKIFEAPLETPEICDDMIMGMIKEAAQDNLEDVTIVDTLAQENTFVFEKTVTKEPTVNETVEHLEIVECPELCITCGNTFPSLKDHESECPVLQMELRDMPLPVREENEKVKLNTSFSKIINLPTPRKLTVPETSVGKSRFVDKRSCSSKNKASSTPKACKIPRFARSTSVTSELSTSTFSDSDAFSSDSSLANSSRQYNKIIKKKSFKKTRSSPNTFTRNVETPRPSSVASQSPRTRSASKKVLVEESSDDELATPKGGWKRKSPRTIMSSDDDNNKGEQNQTNESKKAHTIHKEEAHSQNQIKKPVEVSRKLFPKSQTLSLRSGEKRKAIQNSPRASSSDED